METLIFAKKIHAGLAPTSAVKCASFRENFNNPFRKADRFETMEQSIDFSNVVCSRMNRRRGEGEDEFGNHGRSVANSFSQETEAQGQRSQPRMGQRKRTLKSFKCRMHAESRNQLPIFFFSAKPVSKDAGLFFSFEAADV